MVVNRHPVDVEANILARLSAAGEIALRMLPKMMVQDGPQAGLFCQKIKASDRGDLMQEGVSVPYSVIVLIGVAAAFGRPVLECPPWKSTVDRLDALLAEDRLTLSELGLLL